MDLRFAEVIAASNPRIETLADADAVLAGQNAESESTITGVPFIDYLGGSRGGNFEGSSDFPNGTNNFVIDASAKIMVNKAGTYTFGATVNDAVRIEVDGQVVFADTERHSTADRFATVELTEGEHDVRFVMFDRLGTAVLEFYYSLGEKTEFDSGFQLVGDLKHRPFTELIGSDLQGSLLGVNSSAYVRIPFTHSQSNSVEALILKQQYDDGFVAYLNGTQVVSRNAPEVLSFDSAATEPNADTNAIASELIDLSEFKDLLVDGDNVLAIHALNIDKDDNDLFVAPQLLGTIAGASINLQDSATIRAKVNQNGTWSALVEQDFSLANPASSENLRISEINYNPQAPTEAEIAAGFTTADDFDFIEVVNIGSEPIDLSNVALVEIDIEGDAQGVTFSFAGSDVTELGPGEYAVVVEDVAAFQLRYGAGISVAGQWSGGLSNSGETLILQAGDQTIHQFAYADDWYPDTDGAGATLEVVDPIAAALDQWGTKETWRASSTVNGSPGSATGQVLGDSNRDGIFNSSDLVLVFQAGEYEDGIDGNSTFEEGDWDGDGDFTTRDLVAAFTAGAYNNAATNAQKLTVLTRGLAIDLAFRDWL